MLERAVCLLSLGRPADSYLPCSVFMSSCVALSMTYG